MPCVLVWGAMGLLSSAVATKSMGWLWPLPRRSALLLAEELTHGPFPTAPKKPRLEGSSDARPACTSAGAATVAQYRDDYRSASCGRWGRGSVFERWQPGDYINMRHQLFQRSWIQRRGCDATLRRARLVAAQGNHHCHSGARVQRQRASGRCVCDGQVATAKAGLSEEDARFEVCRGAR